MLFAVGSGALDEVTSDVKLESVVVFKNPAAKCETNFPHRPLCTAGLQLWAVVTAAVPALTNANFHDATNILLTLRI